MLMKPHHQIPMLTLRPLKALGLLAILFVLFHNLPTAFAASITKATTGTDLTAGASWSGSVAPGAGDVANWSTSSLGAGLTAGTSSWLGLAVGAGATDPIVIGSGGTLTLGTSGIDMSAATVNATISSGLTLGAGNQTWTINTGKTLTQQTGTFTRGTAATLLIDKSTLTGTVTASPTLVNSVVPWAMIKSSGTAANNSANGYTFATVTSGNVVAYTAATAVTTGYPANGAATVNYDWSATGTQSAIGSSRPANTIRFTGTAAVSQTVNSTQTETFSSLMNAGGGLVTLGGGSFAMNIQSPAGELVLAAMTSGININGSIINNGATVGAVTIVGPNTVTLANTNTFTGNLVVNSGTLAAGYGLGDPAANGSQGSALGNIGTTVSRSIVVNSGGTLSLTAGNTLGTGGSANTLSAVTLVVNAGGVFQTGANAAGAGWWNKIGAINLNGGTIHVGSGANNGAFQGLALIGTVTVGGSSASTIDNLGSSDSGYNAIHLGQNAATSQSITFNVADVTGNANTDLTIAAKLINTSSTLTASGLTKTGAGTLLLSGANAYTGGTTVSAGTLLVSGSLASGSAVSVSGSGTILGGSGTISGATIITNGGALTPRPSGGSATTLTFGGNLIITNNASVNFTLATTATGSNDKVNFGASSTLTLDSSDTLNITATTLDTANVYTLFASTSGTVSMTTTPTLKINGTTSDQTTPGNYKLAIVGSSLVLQYIPFSTPPTVNSANASPSSLVHNQTTTVTVNVTPASGKTISSVSVGTDGLGGAGDPTSLTGPGGDGTGNWTGTFTVPANKAFSTYTISGTVFQSDSTTAPWTLNVTVAATSPVWSGNAGNNNWSSSANWNSGSGPAPGTVGDSVSFSGNTQPSPNMDQAYSVSGLTLASGATADFSIGGSSTLTVGASGIVNNSTTANKLTLSVPVALSVTEPINTASGNIAITTAVSGTGAGITKTGNGTLTLSGVNTYNGGTTINAGTLTLSGAGTTLGSSANALTVSGGTLDLGGLTTPTAGAVSLASGTIQNGTLTATSFAPSETSSATISAGLAGTFGFTHNTAGTLTLSGANTFTGTPTLTSGTVIMGNPSALGNSANTITFPAASTATLDIQTDGSDTAYPVTSSSSSSSSWTIASDVKTGFVGINHTLGAVGLAQATLNLTAGPNVASGSPKITIGPLNLTSGTAGITSTIKPTTANISIASVTAQTASKILQLDGTSAANEIIGALGQGSVTITLTKANTSTWKLSGTGSFTGGANLNGGVLIANAASALGTAGTITFAGGILQYGSGISDDYSARFATTASQPINIDVNGNSLIYATALAGTSSTLTLADTTGGGTLTLNNTANTYSGNTTVNGGKLLFSTGSAGATAATAISVAGSGAKCGVSVLAAGQQWINSAGATYNANSEMDIAFGSIAPSTTTAPMKVSTLSATSPMTVRVTGSPAGFVTGQSYPLVTWTGSGPSDATAFTTVILPSRVLGNLSVSGGNTLVLNVTGNSGPISWNTGNGSWDAATANWVDAFSASATYVDGSDFVMFDDASSVVGNPTVTLGSALSPAGVSMNSSSHNYNLGGSGGIIGGGSLTVQNGTLTLATTNSYNGGTTVSGGTLQIAGAGTLGSTSGALTTTGGTLDLGASSQTNGVVTISGGAIANGTLTGTSFIANNASAATVSAVLAGSSGLTKSGAGTLTLTAANTFTGNLFGKAGTVVIDSGGKVNTGGNYCSIGTTTNDNATLTLKGTGTFTNSSDFNLGDLTNAVGTLNVQDSASLTVGQFYIGSANATGSTATGTVNQTGGSIFETNSGIGFFAIGGRTSVSGVGIYNMSGGTLTAAAGIRVGGSGTGTLNVSGTAVINANGGINVARLTSSAGTVNLDGGTVNTLNLTSSTGINATNNFNGATVKPTSANTWISGLTVANIRNGGAILDTAGFNVAVPQTLSHSSLAGDNATDGGLTKNGLGTLALSGANTYSGTTTINAGTLLVTNTTGSGTGTGGVIVSGGTLSGSGTIAGAVTVNAGGILTPGTAAIGTLTLGNTLSLAGIANFRINKTGVTITSDQVAGAASVTAGGTLNVTAAGDTLADGDTFTLFNATPAGTFTTINLPSLPASGTNWWTANNYQTLTYNVWPTTGNTNFTHKKGIPVRFSTADLLANVSGAIGGKTIIVNSLGSPSVVGATVVASGALASSSTLILYTPGSPDTDDSFTYTVSDGRGGSATGTVYLTTDNSAIFGQQSPQLSVDGSGNVLVKFYGVPGYTYIIQRSPDLSSWTDISTNAATTANPVISITDTPGSSQAYYRLKWQ